MAFFYWVMGEKECADDIVIPSISELCKPSETNLCCMFPECGRVFKHRPALNMHLTNTHKLEVCNLFYLNLFVF